MKSPNLLKVFIFRPCFNRHIGCLRCGRLPLQDLADCTGFLPGRDPVQHQPPRREKYGAGNAARLRCWFFFPCLVWKMSEDLGEKNGKNTTKHYLWWIRSSSFSQLPYFWLAISVLLGAILTKPASQRDVFDRFGSASAVLVPWHATMEP